MIICAGKSESFDFATPVGIGLVDVAVNLTKICLEQKPESLFFVGSAGSYGRKQLFEITESNTACNIENSFLVSHSYTPIENMITADYNVDRVLSQNAIVSRETIVNSSNYITSNNRYAEAYLNRNIDLENMEFYAVLKVAKMFGIAASGLFIVTNYCDENAHKDFVKNHQEAMMKLTEYVEEKRQEYIDAK